jgi:hypothetical protein
LLVINFVLLLITMLVLSEVSARVAAAAARLP